MKCPCCGEDHMLSAPDLPSRPSDLFDPCPQCNPQERHKDRPVHFGDTISGPCLCNRRFIDDVMASLYQVLKQEGALTGNEPLSVLGTPLISPGLFLRRPPVLPPRSLLLISDFISREAAMVAYQKVPEIQGIISRQAGLPGPGDVREGHHPSMMESHLLVGCDVRTDVFQSRKGPVIIVKKQADLHIEYPKGIDPKVVSVEDQVRRVRPDVFIDACAGPGTLGIIAALHGVSQVLLCDVWHASVWSAIQTLHVNAEKLGITGISIINDIGDRPLVWAGTPVPICIAQGEGIRITVLHGSYEYLGPEVPEGRCLTAFDPFDKSAFQKNDPFLAFWKEKIGGEVFIP